MCHLKEIKVGYIFLFNNDNIFQQYIHSCRFGKFQQPYFIEFFTLLFPFSMFPIRVRHVQTTNREKEGDFVFTSFIIWLQMEKNPRQKD